MILTCAQYSASAYQTVAYLKKTWLSETFVVVSSLITFSQEHTKTIRIFNWLAVWLSMKNFCRGHWILFLGPISRLVAVSSCLSLISRRASIYFSLCPASIALLCTKFLCINSQKYIQSAEDSVPETLVRILHSAEEDSLSPFDSKIACL